MNGPSRWARAACQRSSFWPNAELGVREVISSAFGCLIHAVCVCVCVFLFAPQQAFNATAVIRHMRRLQLGTSTEGPNLTLPSPCPPHLVDAGTALARVHISQLKSFLISFSSQEGCEGGRSQDGDGDPMPNCTYRCHPTGRVWPPPPFPNLLTCLIYPNFPILIPWVEPEAR